MVPTVAHAASVRSDRTARRGGNLKWPHDDHHRGSSTAHITVASTETSASAAPRAGGTNPFSVDGMGAS
jgi:hypothetical protein